MGDSHIDITALSDDVLLARIRAGDDGLFEAWYVSVFETLWRFAYRFVSSADVAKDVVQDVFLGIWLNRESFTVQTSVMAYLYGAVRQRALRYNRHEKVVQRSETAAEGSGEVWGIGAPPIGPDEDVELAERRRVVRQAILALPERQREALSLWLTEERSSIEIAEIFGISDRAVRKLLEKARGRLTEALREAGIL